jgi:hypothetical protein
MLHRPRAVQPAATAITATALTLQMILIDRARLLVRWSDGEQSMIRMQEPGGEISVSKIGNRGNRGGN